jgi:hypothetical protein
VARGEDSNSSSQEEIRKIIPPKLCDLNIGRKIYCRRPMRIGGPNLGIEVRDNKIIVNNYGHGGGGWTLAPGSASYVNNLLLNKFNLKEQTPITIIGAGVMGLFTAYDLCQRGFKKITIIAEDIDSLPSHNAGGLLAPVSMSQQEETQALIEQIGIDAYKFYNLIAMKEHTDFKEGATILPAYFANRNDSGLESYVGKVMTPAKDVYLDFGNGTKRKMVVYDDGIFIDTPIMMNSLTDYLKTKSTLIRKRIKNFNEIDDKYIINCAGIGAKILNGDDQLVPVDGHLILLKQQIPQDLQYMLLI